ncbi:hypothetical protein QVD17_04410 [Tagetes erecta]|uniref:POX domain-containing protein n=1 Tax=Tagetes erecta TaxID=13708 RepID=A0AAD8PAP4_TARER|nr:hypothetical protein QVD17_04410 [Tagetes erecta]
MDNGMVCELKRQTCTHFGLEGDLSCLLITCTKDKPYVPLYYLKKYIIMNIAAPAGAQHQSAHYNLRSSRYLINAHDLLHEFCNLDAKQNHHSTKAKSQRSTNQFQDYHDNSNNMNATSSKNIALSSLELQRRKTKLLHMLDEVDKKYHKYRDQMKALVSSFEVVVGIKNKSFITV